MTSLRILDPIHGLIDFDDYSVQPLICALIDSRILQRLRGIRQLGLSDLVYPGASHVRFSHSLGVAHLARVIVQKVHRQIGAVFTERLQEQVILAALLHDIGHGPYSHVFERMSGARRHEAIGLELLKHPEIQKIFSEFHRLDDLEAITALWQGREISAEVPGLHTIISGALDADRLDYLHRDQVLTGSFQGRFDWPWLLDNIVWSPKGLALGHRAVYAAEEYLLARAHMYQTVYLHRTVRGLEMLLLRFLERLITLNTEDSALQRWYRPETRNIADFLALDDGYIQHLFAESEQSNDALLAEYAARLRYRKPLHCHEASTEETMRLLPRLENTAQEWQTETGVWIDWVSCTPYDSAQPILLVQDGDWRELSEISRIVQSLQYPVQHLRLYYEHPETLQKALHA